MIHNHLTPINSGAVVVLFDSPLSVQQLLFSAPSHSTTVYLVTLPSPHTQSLVHSNKRSIMLHHLLNYSYTVIVDAVNYQDLGPFDI